MKRRIEETPENLRQQVQSSYGEVARGQNLLGKILQHEAESWAQRFGYQEDELASVPTGTNLGLGCGHPSALADLSEGEVVVDLGCGGGFDLCLAAKAVGPTGQAIGIDMTIDMIAKARRAIRRAGLSQAEARLSPMERIPLEDASVDVVISNCAINLSPEKEKVLSEVFRILRPGGRIAISDMVVHSVLPEEVATLLDSYVGCVGGAMLHSEYLGIYRQAGFQGIRVASEVNLGDALSPEHPYVAEIASQSGLGLTSGEINQLLSQISSVSVEATVDAATGASS